MVVMKTLSGTFTVVILTVIAVVAVLSCRAHQAFADKKFVLKFGGPTKEDYAEVKSEDAFKDALKALGSHGGQYKIRFKHDDGTVTEPYPSLSIKTDKVTTSEIAKNAPAGEAAANDPHATYKVSSNSPTDIQKVLDTFK
jgi:hypothetical protein